MKQLILLLLFIIWDDPEVQSQIRVITGIVKDTETQKPLPYCSILEPGTKRGIVSNARGEFKIGIAPDNHAPRLIVHAIGYLSDTLHLIPGKNDYSVFLKPEKRMLESVVITGVTHASLIRENPISIAAITPKQMESTTESNVIDVLVKNVPGLTAVKTGPNISKPFIHGLGYNRVLTLYDGIRQEGQQYGDEHGLEVDDYNIDKAEVIKGPASLLYGSDAIAGVISLFPNIPNENDRKIHGRVVSEYQNNNNLIGNGLRLGYSDDRFVAALRGSYRMAKNYRNPIDGRVYLTNFKETNLSGLAGYKSDGGYTHLNFTLYDNHQGIPDGSRDLLTRKFTKQIYEDDDDILNRPIVTDKELNSYKIPDLAQHIQHYRIFSHSLYRAGRGDVDLILGGQQNIRREYSHPGMPQQAGMFMRLNTLNYGFRYNAPKLANIETSIGLNGMWQENKNKDATDFPIPDYTLYDGGIYLYMKWKKANWSMSGGIRYDIRRVQWDDFYVGVNPFTGFDQHINAANATDADLQFEAYKKLFQGMSGSIGATYQATRNISLKANIGRAYRAPNITEMGSNGLDPGAHIIYIGNRNFRPEFSLQEDLGASFRFRDISARASFFNNNIQNYIYMETLVDEQENPILDAQGNRTYQYQQSAAQLYGTEFWAAIHPEKLKDFRWESSLSTVYGFNRKPAYKNRGTNGAYLPLIPPLKVTSDLSYQVKPASKYFVSLTPKFEMEYNAGQNRYLGLGGTETATPAYTLFNLGVTTEVSNNILIMMQINNLFDRAYQSHLNRLKYFEYFSVSPTGHYGIYNMGRNWVLRVIFPF